MARRKKRERWIPMIDGNSDWIPMKTPCVAPGFNTEGPDPRIIMLVEIGPTNEQVEYGIRLTADEAAALSADLNKQVNVLRRQQRDLG